MPDRSAAPRRAPVLALDALFVLALAAYVASGRGLVPFHGDESSFLWMSRDVHTLLDERDPGAVVFDPATREPLAQWLRVLNGSLTPLAIGLTWRAAGFSVDDLNEPWVWVLPRRPASEQWRFNVSAGRLPDPELLRWARLPPTLFTAASVALVFAIALAASRSRAAAWIAALAYATHPALLLNGRRAMQEGGLLLATALLVWIALHALRARPREDGTLTPGARPREDGTLTPGGWLALAAGTGIALAAKHSAAAVVGAAWLVAACVPWLQGARPMPRDAARHLAWLAGAGLASVALFTALVPVWWSLPRTAALLGLAALAISVGSRRSPRPVWSLRAGALAGIAAAFLAQPSLLAIGADQTRHLVSERRALLREQTAGVEVPPLPARAAALVREAFFAEPQFFEHPAWAGFPEVRSQIEAYRGSFLAGRTGALRWPAGALLAALAVAGAAALAGRGREPESVLLLAWLLFPALAMLASPLPWQRYALLIHAPLAVLAGLGASRLAGLGASRLTGRGASRLSARRTDPA